MVLPGLSFLLKKGDHFRPVYFGVQQGLKRYWHPFSVDKDKNLILAQSNLLTGKNPIFLEKLIPNPSI